MRIVVHFDRNRPQDYEYVKGQMDVFLNEGDKVIYVPSDHSAIYTVMEYK